MKFTFVIPAIWNGGGPRNIYTLSGQFNAHGYPSSVLALSSDSLFGTLNAKKTGNNSGVVKLKNPLGSLNFALNEASYHVSFLMPFELLSSRLSLAATHDSTVYTATAWETAYAVQKVSSARKIPGFYFVQAYETTFRQARVHKCFSACSYLYPLIRFTQSAWLKRFLDSNYGGKTYYLGMGINHGIFRPIRTNSPKQRAQILTIARTAKDKGFDIFVNAISYLRKLRQDFDVVIIGEKDAVGCQKIDFPYEFRGWLSDDNQLAELYRNSIFVNTGIQEALPMPPLEAMACGAVVVMTDMNGSKEYVKDYNNCLLAPVGNSKVIALKINEALSSESLRAELSKNAISTAGLYRWDIVVQRFKEMLKNEDLT